jgi:lipoprotein-releasing system ATP-binding protein
MLIAENIHKRFGDLEVLKGVSLEVQQGEIISIVGRSGAGKTTLLQILGTLERPDSGTLNIQGQEPFKLSSNALAKFRNRHLGFVFQFHQLLPEFTALENVCLPGFIGGEQSKSEVEQRAKKWLDYLGLSDRSGHKPAQLSGGEQQRVAVARALINNPQTIFADEPSGNLDSKNARDLHELFAQLRADFNQTFVIVTHNSELAAMADRTLTMEDGKLLGQ